MPPGSLLGLSCACDEVTQSSVWLSLIQTARRRTNRRAWRRPNRIKARPRPGLRKRRTNPTSTTTLRSCGTGCCSARSAWATTRLGEFGGLAALLVSLQGPHDCAIDPPLKLLRQRRTVCVFCCSDQTTWKGRATG